MKIIKHTFLLIVSYSFLTSCGSSTSSESSLDMDNVYPWCIVAFDSLKRTPSERMVMLKKMGFKKYAYDWRDHHLDEMADEIALAKENDIEIMSVWIWINAKRDSVGKLSPSNERLLNIVEETNLKTTIWLSFSENYFPDSSNDSSLQRGKEMVGYIHSRVSGFGCDLAFYNHGGWFGDPENQIALIKAMQKDNISLVYNFHHAHDDLANFPQLVDKMLPHLSAVNLNGMKEGGPKILDIGKGDRESEMLQVIIDRGYQGPWGILGHVDNEDVELVLKRNVAGLKSIFK